MSKAQSKPYSKKLNEEDKRADNQRSSMRVAHQAKNGLRAKENTPKYSPRSEEAALEYTHHPQEEVPQYTPHPEDGELECTP